MKRVLIFSTEERLQGTEFSVGFGESRKPKSGGSLGFLFHFSQNLLV